jgi:hypothetical protein
MVKPSLDFYFTLTRDRLTNHPRFLFMCFEPWLKARVEVVQYPWWRCGQSMLLKVKPGQQRSRRCLGFWRPRAKGIRELGKARTQVGHGLVNFGNICKL